MYKAQFVVILAFFSVGFSAVSSITSGGATEGVPILDSSGPGEDVVTQTQKPVHPRVRATQPIIVNPRPAKPPELNTANSTQSEELPLTPEIAPPPKPKKKSTKRADGPQKVEEIPWLPLIILTFLITTACTCCKFVRCAPCDKCPMFEHRSVENNRYGPGHRDQDAMRSLNKRFRATAGYPNCPDVEPFQKYIGHQRLRKYREPAVCIVDDKNEIIADTNDIYDSLHNSTYTYIKSNGSNDDMRKYKLDLEEKRRKNIERQEMIDRTKTTNKHHHGGFSVYTPQQTMRMIISKRNTSNDLEAINENMDESRLALAQAQMDESNAPAYTSRENIFEHWMKNKTSTHGENGTDDPLANPENADKWSIHPPSLTPPSTSEESTSQIQHKQPVENPVQSFQHKVTCTEEASKPPEDEITAVECSSSKSKKCSSDYA